MKPTRAAHLAGFVAIVGLLQSGFPARADFATYRTRRTDTAPVIDGALSDPCWSRACRVTSFHPLGTKSDAAADVPETVALLTYDAQALYIAFRCQEPLAAGLEAPERPHDGPVWRDNGVEIFLDPSGDRTSYVQIAVNLAGAVMDGAISEPGTALDLGWETGATAAVQTDANRWSMEVRVPFSGLAITRPHGPWVFHLARNRATAGQHLTSLRTPVSGYHEIANFARLDGIDLPEWSICLLKVVPGEFLAGINLCRVRVRNWTKRPTALQLTAGIEDVGAPKSTRKTYHIGPDQVETITLPWTLGPGDAGKTFLFEARLVGGNRLVRRQRRILPSPPPILGALERPVFYYSQHRFVAVAVPINLAEGSQGKARLQWRTRDGNGTAVGSGFTTVHGRSALLRLYWPQWFPGRYSLDLRLSRNNAIPVTAVQPLRLVANPWNE